MLLLYVVQGRWCDVVVCCRSWYVSSTTTQSVVRISVVSLLLSAKIEASLARKNECLRQGDKYYATD